MDIGQTVTSEFIVRHYVGQRDIGGDRLVTEKKLVVTIRRLGPLITIEPKDTRKYVVRDDSDNQVRLRLSSIPENPLTVQYQLSTSHSFDRASSVVIDRNLVVGQTNDNGEVSLEHLLNIVDKDLTGNPLFFRNTISIRLADSDGEGGPNGYRIPSGDIGNNLSMTIVDSNRLPTVRVARHFSYINNPNPDETEEVAKFEFVATHPTPITEAIVVHYEVTQTGKFAEPTKIGKYTATIPSTNSTTESKPLDIPVIDDDHYEPAGEITVTVLDDQSQETPKYKVVERGVFSPTASVRVISEDAKPVVTIAPPTGGSVKEGNSDGGFMVKATGKWSNEFTVDFTLTEQGGTQNFIETGSPTTLTFPPNTTADSLTRSYNPIYIDSTVETGTGNIMVALNPVTDVDHYTLGMPASATASAAGNDPGVSLSWANGESGTIEDLGLDSYQMVFGSSLVAFPPIGTFELEVSARQSGMTGTAPDPASSASSVAGFSREVVTDYGKWHWQNDNSGFRFDPDADAINRLGDEVVTTTLFVRIVDASTRNQEHMGMIVLTISGSGVPELSISAGSAVTEADGATAVFVVTSDVNPSETIEVSYTPVETGNFFLAPNSANPLIKGHISGTTTNTVMEFSDQSQNADGSGPFSYRLSIPLRDNTDSDTGDQSVTVTLNPDASGNDYEVSAANSSASVRIIDDETLPVLTLEESGNPTEFDESDPAGAVAFKITASSMPQDSYTETESVEIDVRYAASQTGDFIYSARITPDVATTAKLNFYESNGAVTADLSVPIDDDSVGEPTGSVRVTLMSADVELFYYKLGAVLERNSHDVKVYDNDTPELSISIDDVLFIEGQSTVVEFTVASRFNFHGSIAVGFNVWESYPSVPDTPLTPQLFAGAFTSPTTLDFSTSKTQTISIPINDINDAAAPDRYVNVTLDTGTGYTVASADRGGSARIVVSVDDRPELFISGGSAVTESNAAVATFTVTSSKKPTGSSIEVNYTPTETGSFLDPSPQTGDPHTNNTPTGTMMTFADRSPAKDDSGPFTYALEIQLRDNGDTDTGAQSVTVTLDPDADGTDYRVTATNSSASVTIIDDESLPVLTLEEAGNPAVIYESDASGAVTFKITASSMPTDAYPDSSDIEIDVRYTISQTGDFIDTTNGIVPSSPTTSKLIFADSGGVVTTDISIPIAADELEEPDGSVGITLLESGVPLHYYKLGADIEKNSHIVTVRDGDTPILSISAASAVTESDGAAASFRVTSDADLGTSEIPVKYTPTETGSFLDPSPAEGAGHSNGVESTAIMRFADQSPAQDGTGPFVYMLDIKLLNNTRTDSGAQSVTVTLNEAANGADYAISTENTSASVAIIDDESLPVLTLEESGNPLEFDEPETTGVITFKITAASMPMDAYPDTSGTVEIDVRYTVSQTGDFLDATKITPDEATTSKLTFVESDGTVTADLAIPIAGDEIGEPEGLVRVSLLNAETPAYYYKLGVNAVKNSHEVQVYDNKDPELSVSIEETQLTEGEAMKILFTVTAKFNVRGSLSVNLNVWESDPTDPDTASTTNLYVASPPVAATLNFNGTITQQLDIPIEDDEMTEGTARYVNVGLVLGTGYAVSDDGGSARILVLDDDGTVTVPTLSISQPTGTVTETNDAVATFTVTSDLDPGTEAIEVRYTVTATGDILLPPDPAPPASRTNNGHISGEMESVMVVFANGGTGTGPFTYMLEIPLRDNGVPDVRAHTVTVTLNEDADGADYQLSNKSSARILVEDESGAALPFANIASTRENYTEGEDLVFNISMSPAQSGVVRVSLQVSQRGDFIPGAVPKTIRVSSSGAVLEIPTVDDHAVEGEGRVTVEVLDGEDYQPGPNGSATVAIRDNDLPGSTPGPQYSVVSAVITEILQAIPPTAPQGESSDAKPTLSIRAVTGTVDEGGLAVFAVSASHVVSSGYPVKIKLSQSGDFFTGLMDRVVNLQTDHSETEFAVATDNDTLAESDGRITATIQIDSEYLVGSQSTAHVIVSDALDRQHRQTGVSTALHAVLPDLLAHSTARTVEIANNRITQGFSEKPSTSIELNGKSPAITVLQSGGEMLNGDSTDRQSLIDGFSFTVALYPEGGETSPATLWGMGDIWSLASDGNGGQHSWDSETQAGHFGFDARVGQGVLAGLALSVSQSEIGYGQNGGSGMSFDTMTTGFHPYLGFSTSDGNSRMQIVTGYGENKLELKQEEYSPEILRAHYNMVAIGGSGSVYSSDSFGELHNLELNVAGEAWHARQFVDSVAGVADNLQVEAHHIRFAIEESHNHHLGGGGIIAPSFSIGLRGDGRNDESDFGLNLGNGIKYSGFNGLEISGSGISMLSGLNRVSRWEIAGTVDYDSGNEGKGLLFKMSPSWSGADSEFGQFMWESQLTGVSSNAFNSVAGQEIAAEIGFGLEVLDGSAIATPFHGFKQTGNKGIELYFGSRFATNTGISFELRAERNIPESGIVANELNLTGTISW